MKLNKEKLSRLIKEAVNDGNRAPFGKLDKQRPVRVYKSAITLVEKAADLLESIKDEMEQDYDGDMDFEGDEAIQLTNAISRIFTAAGLRADFETGDF